MRLWTLHPKYLDVKGLLAVWREGLLAKKVLEGKTKGYRSHPQLDRFRRHPSPLSAIDFYLSQILLEADRRGYRFNRNKIENRSIQEKIPVTEGQINYEFEHLLKKLETRDAPRSNKLRGIKRIEVNPLFERIPGPVEEWERERSSLR